MKLKNPFSPETREWFRDIWECWICGTNGQDNGGLELHHITGRNSSSAFNAAILCKKCHARIKHTHAEEQELTVKTVKLLHSIGYDLKQKDMDHLKRNEHVVSQELINWMIKR